MSDTDFVFFAASIEDVVPLLKANDLPCEDLGGAPTELIAARGPGGSVVGCVGLECYSDQFLLRSLAVEAKFRSAGLGSELVRLAIERARSSGALALVAVTTTVTGFLVRRGFEVTTREGISGPIALSSELVSVCPVEATILTCSLSR